MSRTCTISVCLALVAAVGLVPGVATPAAPLPPPAAKNFTETLRPADREQEILAVKFEMVYVPAGDFTMGSPPEEPGREANEGPAHRVRVAGFWMGKCEVTWDEFDLYMLDEAYLRAHDAKAPKLGPDAVTRPTNSYVDETYDHGRAGHPVLSITHHAAMMYCHWLRKKTGRDYRLPTEAEWEYAARAGKGDTAYHFGSDPKELEHYAWFKDNSRDEENFPDKPRGCTHKVGKLKPNPFGLHDLYGNVSEWTLDQYEAKAYATRAANRLSIRPVTLPTAKRWSHVVRGGSWADKPEKLRSAARRVSEASWQKHDPAEPKSVWWLTRMDVVGFRVVLPAREKRELAGLIPLVRKESE